jgi:hypothetical protein
MELFRAYYDAGQLARCDNLRMGQLRAPWQLHAKADGKSITNLGAMFGRLALCSHVGHFMRAL